MKVVVKKKKPFLMKKHRRERLYFALSHKDWTIDDWMKPKLMVWGHMRGNWFGKRMRKAEVICWWRGQWSLEVDLWWCRDAWYEKVLDMHARLMGRWMKTCMCRLWMKNFKKALSFTTKPRMTWSFNMIMTPSTLAKRPNQGCLRINIRHTG
jgi:hypothetical protein